MNYGRGRVLWRKRTCVLSTAEIFEILQNSPDLQKTKVYFFFRGWVGYVSCVVELFTMTSVVGGKEKKQGPLSRVCQDLPKVRKLCSYSQVAPNLRPLKAREIHTSPAVKCARSSCTGGNREGA